ncbi:MAG TPA: hypothetical protein VJU86_06170 [Pyrinomonadaceae bacterium]|nr:hypothetical protein [Pyrinomonadaceae bacterium]
MAYQDRAREVGDSRLSSVNCVVCAIARSARSILHTGPPPGVPLRYTPGFTLSPAPRAKANKIVRLDQSGKLRDLSFQEIAQLSDSPIEEFVVDSRPATIATIVQPMPDASLRVVIQGFMNARMFPVFKHVALDGFYKQPDGTVRPMLEDEFYDFD